MECPSCHQWNEAGGHFCEECGFDLTTVANTSGGGSPVSVKATVSASPENAPDPATIPDPPPQTLVKPESQPAPAYSDVYFTLSATGSIFKLSTLTVIGREDPSAQIDLDGYPDGKFVSHRHAQVMDSEGTYYIEDLNSANHTFVNSIRLSAGQSQPLHDGDTVRLGKIELHFHTNPEK